LLSGKTLRNAPFHVCFAKNPPAMQHFSREIPKDHERWNKADLQWSIARLLCRKITSNGPLRIVFSGSRRETVHFSCSLVKDREKPGFLVSLRRKSLETQDVSSASGQADPIGRFFGAESRLSGRNPGFSLPKANARFFCRIPIVFG